MAADRILPAAAGPPSPEGDVHATAYAISRTAAATMSSVTRTRSSSGGA